MLKAHKYRLLPTEENKATLLRWMGMCRFVYNLALEVKTKAWASNKVNITAYDLSKQLTELKHTECTWLQECPAQPLESAIANLDKAYKSFFKGRGFPKFKKRGSQQSIIFRQLSKILDGRIRLSKIGWIPFIEHRPLPQGEIRTVTVSVTPAGNWFVSILVNTAEHTPEKKPIVDKTTVGIDVGLKTFATLSDGQKIENPKYLNQQLKRLRIELRTLSRRYKKGVKTAEQSKGWHKQRLVVAKLHEKISNQRKDFLHKVTDSITKQYDTICLEDLNIQGMMQNRKLSKAISDVSWYEFTRMLEYKAEWRGKNISYIGRFDPSSKTCSSCGSINKELKLSDREWACSDCGEIHDRDINASKNIKSFGSKARPSTVNVSRQAVRMGCELLPL